MTTNVWLQHVKFFSNLIKLTYSQIWTDSKLCWNPKDYGKLKIITFKLAKIFQVVLRFFMFHLS